MASKTLKNLTSVDVEIGKLESKINEFQSYLSQNSIIAQVTSANEILLTEDEQEKRHKEILTQIKMQDALFAWLPLLKKLKEDTAIKTDELRGGQEANGLFNKNK